jgi:hypothetical protein
MAAKVDIFNGALVALGEQDVLIDPEEASTAGKLLRVKYDSVRDATLEAHPWNFAGFLAQVAADAATPLWGFSNQFTLPADPYCLKVRALEDETLEFQVVGRKLLVDSAGPLNLIGTRRVTDTEEFTGLFVETIELHLAAKIAYGLTRSRPRADDLWGQYLAQLRQARSSDGQEGTPPTRADSEFLNARGGLSRGRSGR